MRALAAAVFLTLLASCGGGGSADGGDTAPQPDGPTGPTLPGAPGGQATRQESAQGMAPVAVAPPAGSNIACSGAVGAAARIGTVHFAQTHLLAPSHPFFHLSANRSTMVRASITGNGAAPEVAVTARRNGEDLGTICLAGPATLPASVSDTALSAASSFIGHLPAAWVRSGLELTLRAGAASRTFTAGELKIGPAPELTLVTVDWLLFGDTEPTPVPAGMREELAARLPLTRVNYADFPIKVATQALPIPPRGDATDAAGVAAAQPAVLASSLPHCSAADKAASTCTPWSGFGVISAVRSLTGQLQAANGMDGLSHWYGALSNNQHAGGGLGGGVTGAGDDYRLVFNHELGHAFDMPHWGDALYSKVAETAATRHPYSGVLTDFSGTPRGGGYGDSWAWDPVTSALVNPVCGDGRERQEPMQRGVDCAPPAHVFDFFSDYSALFMHRYFNGAAAGYGGSVASPRDALGNTAAPFAFPTKTGRPNLVIDAPGATPRIVRWNETSGSYQVEDSTARSYGERFPLQWNVPVVTLWGSYSRTTPSAISILPPLQYRGNLKRVWDPTSQADFDAMKAFVSGDAFWWGADLVVKAEFSNGLVHHALVKSSVRGTDALAGDSFTYWAVNLPMPEGAQLKRVSLYHRPMNVRHAGSGSSGYNFAENLNAELNKGLTAARYLDTARLVATQAY